MKTTFSAFFMFLIIACCCAGSATAQTDHADLSEEISISKLVAYAYENNPEILAAKQAWTAILEKQKFITGYPDPQISVTYYPKPIETRVGPQDWNASVSQNIPFPGKLTKAGEVVEVEATIAKLNLDRVIRDINTLITQSYHELLYIQDARKIAQYHANILDEFTQKGQNRQNQDQQFLQDLVKSQSQIAQLSYDIILLDELEMTEITKLNGLLNRPPNTPLGTADHVIIQPLLHSLNELYELAATNREEIRTAQAEIKKADAQLDLAGYENLPEFQVGFFYAGIGEPDVLISPKDAKEDAYGVKLGMSVPLWFGKNTSRTASAKASLQKAKATKNNLVNQTYTQIRTLYFKLTNAERLITLYQDQMLPQAIESLEKAETRFRENQENFIDFVENQKAVYNFQLALARARADYGKTLASLQQTVGVSLTDSYH